MQCMKKQDEVLDQHIGRRLVVMLVVPFSAGQGAQPVNLDSDSLFACVEGR